jgi:hypoxanthine phosphoribosyltransferase
VRILEAPLLTREQIQHRVTELAEQISSDFAGRRLMVITVLKGGLVFAADLIRGLTIPVYIDFIRARSYQGTESAGNVTFSYLPEESLAGKHVLVVEDILDTGRTAAAILERLRAGQPASLLICTLLDKPARRETPLTADYVGFTIDNHFVIGYGLDYEERGRELSGVYVMEED